MAAEIVDQSSILTEADLDTLYAWLDEIPFSRSKRNVALDFSDGVLVAELMSYYFPKFTDLQGLVLTFSQVQKKVNWNILNRKALAKISIQLSDATIQQVTACKSGAIEQVLWDIRRSVLAYPLMKQNKHKTQASFAGDTSGYDSGSEQGVNYAELSRKIVVSSSRPRESTSTEPPSQIIYRGVRMVPLLSVLEKRREIEALKVQNEDLEQAQIRLDSLITVKEHRLQELTRLYRLKYKTDPPIGYYDKYELATEIYEEESEDDYTHYTDDEESEASYGFEESTSESEVD